MSGGLGAGGPSFPAFLETTLLQVGPAQPRPPCFVYSSSEPHMETTVAAFVPGNHRMEFFFPPFPAPATVELIRNVYNPEVFMWPSINKHEPTFLDGLGNHFFPLCAASVCRVHEWGLSELGLSWPAIKVLFISKWTAWRCGQGHHRPSGLPGRCSDGHAGRRSRLVTAQFLLWDRCRPTRRRMRTTYNSSPLIPQITKLVFPPFVVSHLDLYLGGRKR